MAPPLEFGSICDCFNQSRMAEVMQCDVLSFFLLLLIFFNVYLFLREKERERVCVSGGGTEREGDIESKAGSRLRAVSTEPDVGLELTNREIMT